MLYLSDAEWEAFLKRHTKKEQEEQSQREDDLKKEKSQRKRKDNEFERRLGKIEKDLEEVKRALH